MNVKLVGVLLAVSLIVCPLLYVFVGPAQDAAQLETFKLLLWICGGSVLFCFVVGELTHNNSQMDKLWSLLPIVYTWVIAARGDMAVRLVVMAVLVTLWGIRLTYNFGRKGAYRLRFWEGEEDYRWKVLLSLYRCRWCGHCELDTGRSIAPGCSVPGEQCFCRRNQRREVPGVQAIHGECVEVLAWEQEV